jgi:small subunit ribosomal protein S8
VIRRLERISKPSRRVYVRKDEIAPVYSGTGIAIISTSKGILTDKEARKESVGGEILCHIW